MTIRSLRSHIRADNLSNQVRAGQSLARRIYLALLLLGLIWLIAQFVGPMILMDADGLVVQDREVVMPSYPAQVISVAVVSGDIVHRGQLIATMVSTQMLDLVSDLTTRQARARSRLEQIKARLDAINSILAIADARVNEATRAYLAVERARSGGFSTSTRSAEVANQRYTAINEAASLRAEASGLKSERSALEENAARIDASLEKAVRSYRNGAVFAPTEGTVGPRVAAGGTVLNPGDHLAEIFHGEKYVIGYLTTRRLYTINPGQKVIITDGVNRQIGHVQRVEAITDRVPAEFQRSFHSVDRQQVVRVAMENSDGFPLMVKVEVTTTYAPSNLLAEGQAYVVSGLGAAFSFTIAAAKSLRKSSENRQTARGEPQ